jgi:hypothetical protein
MASNIRAVDQNPASLRSLEAADTLTYMANAQANSVLINLMSNLHYMSDLLIAIQRHVTQQLTKCR